MAKQLLVRNVPDDVQRWIDKERLQQRMTQQEFVLSVLQRASMFEQTLSLPFFSGIRNKEHPLGAIYPLGSSIYSPA